LTFLSYVFATLLIINKEIYSKLHSKKVRAGGGKTFLKPAMVAPKKRLVLRRCEAMFYSKEQLEALKKEAEERMKEREEENRPRRYQSQDGTPVICLHCRNDLFHKSSALLNTRGMTFLGLDWLNESAITLICDRCGYIHWFWKDLLSPDCR
jgi:predicted nucleic-acid-binding Zn-ribbon protein